jgi:hypothetical protein
MSAIENQDEKIREDLRAAVAQVAKAHGISVTVGDVTLSNADGQEVANIERVSIAASDAQIEAIMQKFYEARAAHAKLHSKKHYRYRMAVAVTIGAGIYGFYYVMHREFVLHGLEYLVPAIVDKLIFGIEIAE